MEYEKGDGSPASVPEFGAIFMCSFATMKECHRLKLLGLPASQENFVKQVKSGMILFLFEFEKRELYGVYQACSDGAMDIVPNAFRSSGKQFPAQVSFRVVWNCNPLPEHELQDAISENYYSKKKFTFGLSDDQVRRLLCLFSATKLENRVPRGQFVGPTMSTGKERIPGNEKFSLRNRGEMFVEEDNPAHTTHIKYNGNSLNGSQRRDNKRFGESSLGYDTLTEREWTTLGRRKRLAGDSMNLMEGKPGFEAMSPGPVGNHDLRDRLYGARGQSKENQFLFRDTVETGDIGEAITSLRHGDFMAEARRGFVDDRVQMRDLRGDKHTQSRDGFRFGVQAESFEILQTELRRPIDDQEFFMDRKVDYDYNLIDGPKLISDDGQSYMDDRIECSLDNGISPIVSDRLDEVKRLTYARRHISAEQCSSRLNYGGKLHYQESQIHADNDLGSDHSEFPPYRINQSDYKHMLLKRGGVDNGYTAENSRLPLSTEYADLYQPEQQPPSFNSRDPMLEENYSPSQNQHKPLSLFPHLGEHSVYGTSYPTSLAMEKNKYGVPYPSSHDSVVTRPVPYDREFPEVNVIPHSVRDFVPHHSRPGNNFSASIKASPYCMEDEDSSPNSSNGAFLHASEIPMHDNQDLYDHYDRGGYRGKMEQPFNEIYDNPLPFLRSPIYDRRNISPSIEFNEHAQDRVYHKFQENVKDSAFNDHQDLLMNYDIGYAHLRPSENFENYDVDSYQDTDRMATDSKNRRTSVFSRLSKASRKRKIEGEGRMEDVILDQSVDQVMGTVFECLSQKTTGANKHSSLGKRCITEETLKRREKRFNQIKVDEPMMTTRKMVTESKLNNTEEILKRRAIRFNQIEVDKPTLMTQKMVNECKSATEDKKNEDLARETRVVEFKRRSDTKKIQNGRNEKVFKQEAHVSVQKQEATMEKNGDVAKENLVVEIKCRSEISKSQNGELGEGIIEPTLEQETQVSAQKPEGERENDEDVAKGTRRLEFNGTMEKNGEVAKEKLVVEIKHRNETSKSQNEEKGEDIIKPALEQETQVSAQKPEGESENDEDVAKGARCLEFNGTIEKNGEVAEEKLVLENKCRSENSKSQNGEKGEGIIEPSLEQETQVSAQKLEGKRENDEDVAKETRDLEFKGGGETNESQNGVKGKGFIEPALKQKTEDSSQKPEGNMEVEVERKQLKRRKLVRPVFDKKAELNESPKKDAYSNSQLAHERSQCNMVGSCDFADTSLGNSNCPSSNSRLHKRLIRPLFGKKEESNDNSKRDQVSGLQLSSSHESPNNQKAATRESSSKTLGNLNCPSPNSGSLVLSAPIASGKSKVILTSFNLRRNSF